MVKEAERREKQNREHKSSFRVSASLEQVSVSRLHSSVTNLCILLVHTRASWEIRSQLMCSGGREWIGRLSAYPCVCTPRRRLHKATSHTQLTRTLAFQSRSAPFQEQSYSSLCTLPCTNTLILIHIHKLIAWRHLKPKPRQHSMPHIHLEQIVFRSVGCV